MKGKMNEKAIKDHLGKPADIDRQLQVYHRAARVLSSNHPRLINHYPKQWVAVYKGRVRAHGNTYNAVVNQIVEKGLPREHVLMRFIDKNQRTMIL